MIVFFCLQVGVEVVLVVEVVVSAATKTVAGMKVAVPPGSAQLGEARTGHPRMVGMREEVPPRATHLEGRVVVTRTVVGLVEVEGLVAVEGSVEVGEGEEGEDVVEGGEALDGSSQRRMEVMRRDQGVDLVVGVAVVEEGFAAAVEMTMTKNLEIKNQVSRLPGYCPGDIQVTRCAVCCQRKVLS